MNYTEEGNPGWAASSQELWYGTVRYGTAGLTRRVMRVWRIQWQHSFNRPTPSPSSSPTSACLEFWELEWLLTGFAVSCSSICHWLDSSQFGSLSLKSVVCDCAWVGGFLFNLLGAVFVHLLQQCYCARSCLVLINWVKQRWYLSS